MRPDDGWRGGVGRFFEVTPNGGVRELWKTEGWYAYRISISWDGESLIRVGGFDGEEASSRDGVALQFYKHGQLLKSYSVRQIAALAELDFASVVVPSDYRGEGWESEDQPLFLGLDDEFVIRLIDGSELVFKTDGKFKTKKPPNPTVTANAAERGVAELNR